MSENPIITFEELLKRSPMFSSLSEESLARITQYTFKERYNKKETIQYEQGVLKLILHGSVRETMGEDTLHPIWISFFKPGDILGVWKPEGTLTAMDKVEVLRVVYPEWQDNLAMSQYSLILVKDELQKMKIKTFQSLSEDVMSRLVREIDATGIDPHAQGAKVELGLRLGTSREMVSKCVAKLYGPRPKNSLSKRGINFLKADNV